MTRHAGILIGWEEAEVTTPEEGQLTVCASVFLGAVEQEETLDISFRDISTRTGTGSEVSDTGWFDNSYLFLYLYIAFTTSQHMVLIN